MGQTNLGQEKRVKGQTIGTRQFWDKANVGQRQTQDRGKLKTEANAGQRQMKDRGKRRTEANVGQRQTWDI